MAETKTTEKAPEETGEVRISAADLADIRAKLKEASDAAKSAEARAARAENAAALASGQAASAVAANPPVVQKDSKVTDFGGSPGAPFAMYGDFGEPGTVTFNGRVVVLTSWREESVRGMVPADMRPGPIKIEIDGKAMDIEAQLR
jgi:hypothetical protein